MKKNLPLADGRGLAVLSLVVLLAVWSPAPAQAAAAPHVIAAAAAADVDAVVSPQPLPRPVAFGYFEYVLGDQVRMIQVSLVVLAIGIMFLMWGKSK